MIFPRTARAFSVVTRIYPNTSDFENLSKLRTEAVPEANQFDYARVVVRKPWGYEYLWHQNAAVAIWMLHLKAGCATSMHCHARKRTSLIVMSGVVVCSTFDDRYRLTAGQAVVLEPCVFHTTMATGESGACVMEIETPPMKGDLLRYRDNFGRVGQGYEDSRQYTTEVGGFDYAPLRLINPGDAAFACQGTQLRIRSCFSRPDLSDHLAHGGLMVPLLGRLMAGSRVVADIGETVAVAQLPAVSFPEAFPPVELLQIRPGSIRD